MIERVRDDIGPYFQSQLAAALELPLVGEVRGIGLMAAIQLCADKNKRTLFEREGDVGTLCREHSLEAGLVMRAVGDAMVLSPPLVITRSEVDELVEKAITAIDRTARDVLGPRYPNA